jgi:hypothetical protein
MEIEFIEDCHLYLKEGIIVPSVSEVLRFIFPDKYKGIPQKVLEEKAAFGTHIHEAIEAYESGKEYVLAPLEEVVFNQYLKLKKEHDIQVVSQEEIVSYEYDFCGRLDSISIVDGVETLLDYKTTSKLDKESLSWQLGMYQLAKGKSYARCACLWLPKKELGKIIDIKPKTKEEILEMLERYKKCMNV